MAIKDVVLRCANLDDLLSLQTFEQGIIDAERPFNKSIKKTDVNYYDLADIIQNVDSEVVVGEHSGQLVCSGFIQTRQSKSHFEHSHHGYLGFMYVVEEFRGQGLNRLVIDYLVNWGKKRGLSDFYLEAYTDNTPAIRAYTKMGFEPSKLSLKLSV
jgi:ribosomal protein S18 acetylase RimI-like enzyme